MAIAIELEKRVGNIAEILRDPESLHDMLSRDPVLARELRQLQDETRRQLDHLVAQIEAAGAGSSEKHDSQASAVEMSFSSLRSAAKKREAGIKERNETIRTMCLAVMVNSANPKWNPRDETTYCRPEDSTLLALIEADLGRY